MIEESKKPFWYMTALGITRHLLVVIGMWLKARGWIDEATHAQLTGSDTAVQLLADVMVIAPVAWSVIQKWQVWGWLKTKVHIPAASTATPQQIITASPGPNNPI